MCCHVVCLVCVHALLISAYWSISFPRTREHFSLRAHELWGQRSNSAKVLQTSLVERERMSSMRRSQRSRAKSLKAELEEDVLSTYKRIKLKSQERKEDRCASIRTQESEGEGDYENEEKVMEHDISNEEQCSSKTKKRAKSEVEKVVDRGSEPEGQEVEEEGDGMGVGVGEGSGHGRWTHYTSLCSRLPGRERQIQLLLSLLGEVSSTHSHQSHLCNYSTMCVCFFCKM